MLPPWLMLAAVAPKPKRKLICKSAGECKKANCEHIAEHERDYVCSHWCNEKRAIISCRVVG